ncbi:MAG: GMP reductase [Alphaproteobacteria bacterium]
MRIEEDIKLDYSDVLIRPKRSRLSSRSEVELVRDIKFVNSSKTLSCIPIMAANMDTTGTFETARILGKHKMLTVLNKHYSVDELCDFFIKEDSDIANRCFFTMGILQPDEDKLDALLAKLKDVGSNFEPHVCIDVANGYTERFIGFIEKIRQKMPNAILMAGNVVTAEMTEQLILSGADIVKVGIGPGSVCTTRRQTGVGYPQLSAAVECADAAHGLAGHICADGGITVPGDLSKSFGAGADFTMLGGMMAGHDESAGELVEENGKKFKLFYGMSSDTAMNKYAGGVADYRSSEGKTVKIAYKGPLEYTVLDILGGLRSACTYVGAKRLKELSKRTTFIRVNRQLNNVYTGQETD